MTYEVYFHAPKCTFNTEPDPIWDQKWNDMDPCMKHINCAVYKYISRNKLIFGKAIYNKIKYIWFCSPHYYGYAYSQY